MQLSLPGLIVFTISLVAASSLLTRILPNREAAPRNSPAPVAEDGAMPAAKGSPEKTPPWGKLQKDEILLERPEEYVAFELMRVEKQEWHFGAATEAQARQRLRDSQVPAQLIDLALAPGRTKIVEGDLILQPEERVVLGLTPESREKLYRWLAKQPGNHYMHSPFMFPKADFDRVITDDEVAATTQQLIKRLAYPRGGLMCFSDLGYVLERTSTENERLQLVKALSRISALMVRLRLCAHTDIDKLVNYWGAAPGVRPMDLRPLLESVQRLEGGGSVSLIYLLPPFARERLFTFPLHSKFGEEDKDCHWSTMNFFREEPDNRFCDYAFTSAYIENNYYSIAKPTQYGDLVFVVDGQGNAIHSAVYLADDVVFTKNGSGFMQPWVLMRLKDVAATYSDGEEPKLFFCREKSK